MGDRNGVSVIVVIFAIATLLSCFNPASSLSILPRVTRTSDAIIIDFAEAGYNPFFQGKSLYSDIVNPAVVPVSSINPYYAPAAAVHNQQQPTFKNGWFYSFGYPSQVDSPSKKQLDESEVLEKTDIPSAKQGVQIAPAPAPAPVPVPAPAPVPVIKCGRGPSTMPASRSLMSERISGGAESKKNAWPFMVLILSNYKPLCAGTLISETRVLLAAQCMERLNSMDVLTLSVAIGLHSTKDAQISRRITRFVLHSQFNAATYANDIAILTLDGPVPFSRTVGPACLPPPSTDPDQYAGQDAIVLGWDASEVLMQGKVSMATNDDCRILPLFGQYVSNSTTCVTGTGVFTCTKDIGGPVVIAVPPTAPATSPVSWTLVGINSFTDPDCGSNGLKTRVSAFRAWIDLYMTA